MKTSPEDIEVLLVGGGSIITPSGLRGVAKISRPPFYSVANAVGAAMARGETSAMLLVHPFSRSVVVAGEVDTIEFLQGRTLESVLEPLKLEAIQKAIRAGANPGRSHLRYQES